MARVSARARHWRRVEYERLVETGFFAPGEPIELIAGQLLVAEPKGSAHAATVGLVGEVLRDAFGPDWTVRLENPVALDDESEPEPDLAVVPGRQRDYVGGHPTRPALVVEVADTSLAFDRVHKGSLYARAGVADYWIVNLLDRVIEICREPARDSAAPFGWSYRSRQTAGPGSAVSPLARADVRLAVAALLP